MLPAFLVNYVIGRRHITKVKVDRWMSQGFFPEKKYMQKNNTSIFMFAYTKVLHEYMHSLRNNVCNLFVNTHVRIKIYRKLYHGIIYTANEGRHVRI
jgi:hypothetical protein